MQSIFVFSDITKFADFRWKNADVSRIQGVGHKIHIFFGSSLGQVSPLPILTFAGYVWQILGTVDIFGPLSMSNPEKSHPE